MSSNRVIPQRLDFEQIKEIIPQRFPFAMLDRVIKIEPNQRIIGVKNLSGNEWFYQGHFPKKAVTPGAMICEAIAQTGIIFFHFSRPKLKNVTYLLGNLRIRFLQPVWPGDQMQIEVTAIRLTALAAILQAEVTVNGKLTAKGEFGLAAKHNREL